MEPDDDPDGLRDENELIFPVVVPKAPGFLEGKVFSNGDGSKREEWTAEGREGWDNGSATPEMALTNGSPKGSRPSSPGNGNSFSKIDFELWERDMALEVCEENHMMLIHAL
ncbi:unnamed protein product [Cylicostephanus goldi]|uniref:Uncharacterized protein n=1 Tax=Cylicostephanus goldi TaxID=71465 RepID=A0A3P6SG40_CYLGO|nr:unnamed protein product [Cylicostephanus goldi]